MASACPSRIRRFAGLGERLLRAGLGALELAEVAVGGGQAEQRHDLGMTDADLARQAGASRELAQGSLRVAEAALDRGQGVAGQRLAVAVVDVTGQREGRSGEVEGLGVAAGFTTDGGETAEAERFAIPVPRPPEKDQGLACSRASSRRPSSRGSWRSSTAWSPRRSTSRPRGRRPAPGSGNPQPAPTVELRI